MKTLLPHETCDEIADLAKIPATRRPQFRLDLSDAVYIPSGIVATRRALHKARDRQSRRAILKAAREFRTALNASTPGTERYLNIILSECAPQEPLTFVQTLDVLIDELANSLAPEPRRTATGRRPGISDKSYPFHFLVARVVMAARHAGGDLKYDKNYNRGSLKDALGILREFAAPGLIPAKLPASTVQRIKTADQKLAAAVEK